MKLGDVLLAAICGLVITTSVVHMINVNTSVQQEQQVKK